MLLLTMLLLTTTCIARRTTRNSLHSKSHVLPKTQVLPETSIRCFSSNGGERRNKQESSLSHHTATLIQACGALFLGGGAFAGWRGALLYLFAFKFVLILILSLFLMTLFAVYVWKFHSRST